MGSLTECLNFLSVCVNCVIYKGLRVKHKLFFLSSKKMSDWSMIEEPNSHE